MLQTASDSETQQFYKEIVQEFCLPEDDTQQVLEEFKSDSSDREV